jgi:iron complex outermembrane receptor protein
MNYRGRRFFLRPTLFYSRLTDFIVVHSQARINSVPGVTNPAARSYENVAAKIYGGELSYSVGITRAILFLGGLSYARGIKEPRPALGILDRNLAEMPPMKSRTALRWGTKVFFAEAELAAVPGQDRVDTDLGEERTAGYALLNLKGGIHTSKLSLTAGIDNLFNRFYYEHLSFQRDPFRLGVKVPEPGRSFYVNVSYSLQKAPLP